MQCLLPILFKYEDAPLVTIAWISGQIIGSHRSSFKYSNARLYDVEIAPLDGQMHACAVPLSVYRDTVSILHA